MQRTIVTSCERLGFGLDTPIVEGSRIGVHDVIAIIQTGATVDEVVASLIGLTRSQVFECLAYYEGSIHLSLRGSLTLTSAVRLWQMLGVRK